jgi:AcrR family transcriptional regulator
MSLRIITVTVRKVTERDNPPSTPLGLRDQRKLDTRARISAAAMRLFAARGFDEVRTAEVAEAAGVTEKTVFNHFPTKEDLVYSNEGSFEQALVGAIQARGPEVSIVKAAEAFFLDLYGRFPAEPAMRKRAAVMASLIEKSPALRDREQAILRGCVDCLAKVIGDETSANDRDLRPFVAADAIIAVHRAAIAGYRRGLSSGEPAKTLGSRMQRATSAAFTLLAEGLGSIEVQAGQRRKPRRTR